MKTFKTSHHTYLAGLIFFLLVTAQTLWSTVHGDGAVYAALIRQICTNGSDLLSHPLTWMQQNFFIDHPYLFFYFAAPISKIFGTGDIGIKIPNYIVGFISLWMVYKTSKFYSNASVWPGLLACYVLITNPLYELMLRQPTLDPLAQLLSLFSVVILLLVEKPTLKRFFFSGVLMGLAFLTKGLELLPNLAALFILVCLLCKKHNLNFVKVLLCGIMGIALPLAAWIGYDRVMWNQTWLKEYYTRQFTNRFFNAENTQTALNFNYFKNLISKYFIQIGIIIWGTAKAWKQDRKPSLFWWYTVVYTFFNIVAFSIIKKDSSQHLTGIFLFSSVLAGQYIYELYQSMNENKAHLMMNKILPYFHYTIAVAIFVMWGWMMTHKNTKNDLWTFIKNQTEFFNQPENNLPIIVSDDVDDITGVYFTGQWYWSHNKVYFPLEAKKSLSSQEVFLITKENENSFKITRALYTP